VVESTCEGFFVSRYLLCLSGNASIFLLTWFLWHQTYLNGRGGVYLRGVLCIQKPALSFRKWQASSYWRDFYDIKHTLTEVVESTCEGFFASRSLLCLSGNASIFLLASIWGV
jgi:hypothetical protein